MRVKIIQKTVLTFCLLALAGFSAPMLVHGAEDRQSTDSDFHIDKEGCLTSYTGSEEHVVIPEGVKRIGGNPDNSIFEDTETEIKSVVIPDSVIEIGERAFYTCLQLEEVTMGNGVKKIGQEAFAGCFKMKTIHLSDSLQEIGLRAFNFCESLEALELPSSLRNIEMEAFGNCISLKSLNIPDGVQAIPPGTFDRCSSMEELYIPSSVTKIGAGSKLMPQYVGERTGLEDASMQSTVIPDSEEEELETQEEEEEVEEEETDKGEEEKKESSQKTESGTSVDRVQIVGLTVGAVGLVIILLTVVIQIIRNSRRK